MPEASMNPFGYKFSWSPRGVLTASTQPSKYLQEGHERNVDGQDLFSRRQEVSRVLLNFWILFFRFIRKNKHNLR